MRPVYDENGVMYSNECVMKRAKCKDKKKGADELEKSRENDSASSSTAGEDSADEVDSSSCRQYCFDVYDPVSDEQGNTYSNECYKRRAKCKDAKDKSASTKKSGSSSPSTKCSTACPNVDLLVCGSDGIKYSNPCELKAAACKNPELDIVEADDDECVGSKVAATKGGEDF